MRIYTRFGDQGRTQLPGGQQTRKNDIRIVVCGALDELNAVLGVVASLEPPEILARQITIVQSDLLSVGSLVASVGVDTKINLPTLDDDDVSRLEQEIDSMEKELETLTNFILPGGAPAAAMMHLARSICRRAERELTDLTDEYANFVTSPIVRFMNRLSDWCFVSARWINQQRKVDEPKWRANR